MAQKSWKGSCARGVSPFGRPGVAWAAAGEVGSRLAKWASQAQSLGTQACRRARQLIRESAAAAATVATDGLMPRRSPALESLEGRRMLSSVTLSGGVLTLVGNASTTNNLSVDMGGNGTLLANADGVRLTPAISAVRSIHIVGGSQQDLIYVNPAIVQPVNISSSDGNDIIKSGSASDTIVAGNGDDQIWGSGNIQSGNGSSTITVGSLSSSVRVGNGNNVVMGGRGNDTLISGSGYDTVIAGNGIDVLQGGAHTLFRGVTARDQVTGGIASQPSPTPVPAPTPQPPTPSTSGSTTPTGPEDATVTGSNHGDSLAPTPVIQVLGVSGPAGHSVFVDALNSTLGSGQPIDTTYQWNFGDPGSRFNVLPGWNAGHLYQNPGTYTITLTITNQLGRSSTLSTRVTVTPNARRTIYVDSVYGNDANSGLSTGQPIRSIARVNQLLADNTTVLFRAGETFSFNNISIYVKGNNESFGTYGSGAAPVLMKVAGQSYGMFDLASTADQVVIKGFTFDSVWKPIGNIADHIDATGIYPAGRNVSILNNTFLNIDYAVNAYRAPTGMLVQDNSCPLMTGLRGYLEYIDGTEQAILGNYVANSTREHDLRSTDDPTSRILIAGNTLSNPSRQSVDPADFPKTTINVRSGSYFYIADNTINDAMIGLGPGAWTPASWSASNIVVTGNTMHNAQIYAASAVHHLMVSNNFLDVENTSQIWIVPVDPTFPTRYMTDITIENNTGVSTSATGSMLELDGPSPAGIITVRNNLFADPNFKPGSGFAASVYIRADDTSAFASFSHNVWAASTWNWSEYPGAVNFVSTALDIRNYRAASQWNAQRNVQDDQFRVTSVSAGRLQVSIDGQLAGAVMPTPLS